MNKFVADDELQIGGGKYVSVLDPSVDDITIYHIAHSLSNTGRYGGHARFFYPVAQHCVIGSYKAHSTGIQWDFLMHDATEAFILDVPSPLKYQLDDYRQLEKIWEPRISNKFSVYYPFLPEVKKLDVEALATERRDLLHPNGVWKVLQGVRSWKETIHCWHPLYAEYRFLKRADELRPELNIKVPGKFIPLLVQGVQRFAHWYLKLTNAG